MNTSKLSDSQENDRDLEEPVPEDEEAYVYVLLVAAANGALQPSIRFAGKEAPEP